MGWFYDCKDTKGHSNYDSLVYSENNEVISSDVLIMKGTSSSKSLFGFCPVSAAILWHGIREFLAPLSG